MTDESSFLLVDRSSLEAMVEDFDPDIMQLLLETAQTDIEKWSEKLIESWASDDQELRKQTRHSLKGLCGNFGARRLLHLTGEDLSTAAAIDNIRACRAATFVELNIACEELSAD